MDREGELIERIARAVPSIRATGGSRDGLLVGIGDDAAILAPRPLTRWVLSCDAFIEGIHFLAETHPADSVGYKALVRAASDLAAMGAKPRYFLLTLTLPATQTGKWLEAFSRGLGRAARLLGMRLIGGDTTKARTVFVSVTVIGEIASGGAVLRSGARPGDLLYVSGRLGRAELGLRLVKLAGLRPLKPAPNREAWPLQPHLYPKIRVELGSWLARHKIASAMMDISDGLSSDLARLCAASGVGARLWAERIPCVRLPRPKSGDASIKRLARLQLDPLQLALHGGEGYELLFAVPPERVKLLRRAPGFSELSAIGEIVRGRGSELVGADGRARPLVPGGWDPFHRK